MPFVEYNQELGPGETVEFTIEYYVPERQTPQSTLCARPTASSVPYQPAGTPVTIDRSMSLPDGTFMIEFTSVPGQLYYIQYCDGIPNWKTAMPGVSNGANRIQWIDNGPPKTDSNPNGKPGRFYRVITSR